MRKFLFILLAVGMIFSTSCNKKSTSNSTSRPNSTSTSSAKKYQVSKVYKYYEQLAPRLKPKAGDKETIYIVSFWATWCVECRKEMPEMVRLDNKYKNNPKVKVLFVNLDDADRQRLVNPFLRKYNISGEVVSLTDPDQEKWIDAIDRKWTGSLPGTLFFKGEHRKFYTYPLSFTELERNIGFMKAKK